MGAKVRLRPKCLPDANNLDFVEQLYEQYGCDPTSVTEDWRRYFAAFGDGELRFSKPRFAPSFKPFSLFNPPGRMEGGTQERRALERAPRAQEPAALQDRVYLLIRLYRVR